MTGAVAEASATPRVFRAAGTHTFELVVSAFVLLPAWLIGVPVVLFGGVLDDFDLWTAAQVGGAGLFLVLLTLHALRSWRAGPDELTLDDSALTLRTRGRVNRLPLADLRRVAVGWARVHVKRIRAVPVVRLETGSGARIDLEVAHSEHTSLAMARFDVREFLYALWPLLPWDGVTMDPRVPAFMSTGDSKAFFPRRDDDPWVELET